MNAHLKRRASCRGGALLNTLSFTLIADQKEGKENPKHVYWSNKPITILLVIFFFLPSMISAANYL